ncbi:hypothetical protein AcW1_008191 [Taiwanofungus camphoratus]|nr:hypothetical protein AcV5_008487 [Antrodia cinnamomea]KAI0951043.1 hypothetical protein AcW1_008191 [Antrodia cinnamomea]KAI0955943.1 hypothetical protein AcV7_006478 [Antrodia cinnamomea]
MFDSSASFCFAYYCSGHGYGHATRVSAFACYLLRLDPKPVLHIVSSAPRHVFADSIALGALYRYADIDPVIVQPVAYRVDRQKSVDVLQSFLRKKPRKVLEESQWLTNVGADCVLSDAAFLGCLAANHAGLPSVLITNFTFDSVYSYLSTPLIDPGPEIGPLQLNALQATSTQDFAPDVPIPLDKLAPLVDQLHSGYRCADLLLRLPGAIPIPSFWMRPSLPSPDWVSQETWSFTPAVTTHLLDPPSNHALHPSMPFSLHRPKPPSRTVVSAPLIVRSPDPSVYDPAGRSRFLESIGIPSHLHDPNTTRILIVSFGGQIFHRPQSRCHSRSSSAVQTPGSGTSTPARTASGTMREPFRPRPSELSKSYFPNLDTHAEALTVALHSASLNDNEVPRTSARIDDKEPSLVVPLAGTRPRATSVLNVPGAPPAAVPTSPTAPGASKSLPTHPAPVFATVTIPPSPDRNDRSGEAAYDYLAADGDYEEEVSRLLPDDSWIAIVCGVSKEWGKENGEELPHNFFVAPRDVYMPDLTAVADVLLGKLGYGTVSECVDSCTPFVYGKWVYLGHKSSSSTDLDCQ